MISIAVVSILLAQRVSGAVGFHSLSIDSKVLQGNPLRDATRRNVAIFRVDGNQSKRLPIVFYLPGFGGSSDESLASPNTWLKVVSDLHAKGVDVVLAVVDGRNRFGCSQYVNSPGSGRYMDYLCDEILPFVEKQENCGGSQQMRLVVGHSSGGFGALRIGMARKGLFGGIVALSPDSYFDVTHKPFTVDPAIAKIPLAKVRALMAPTYASLDSLGADAGYVVALCADYAGNNDGTFDWLYDGQGKYRSEVYARWQDADPAILAERSPHPFSSSQRVYLDGAAQDDFKANIGAAKVAEALKSKNVRFTAYYPPGHHSDHLKERVVRGVSWVLGKPLDDIR